MTEQDWFEELFGSELDSWFTADIACCDECYDDFVGQWPLIYLKDISFQESGIGIREFYSGSRMSDFYTEDEFLTRAAEMGCPNCHNPLRYNIWPYNLPYCPPSDFEDYAGEIAHIASRTPFLVLGHEYAQLVRDEIAEVAACKSREVPDDTFYRARIDTGDFAYDFSNLGAPPAHLCKKGRYNHPGHPVLYLASNRDVCIAEISNEEDPLVVADFEIKAPLAILDLSLSDGLLSIDNEVLGSLIFSSMASSPYGESTYSGHEYFFSRFVADCCLDAGFDAIAYPSTKPVKGYNLAILDHALATPQRLTLVSHRVVQPS